MTDKTKTEECRCAECAREHSEFIGVFGKWPTMSHEETQALKRRREDNLRSWDRLERSL